MLLPRMRLAAALAAAAGLAAGAPAASADTTPNYFLTPTTFAGYQWPAIATPSIPADIPAGDCSTSSPQGQGRTGGNANQSCVGAGLSFIGPSTSISNVVGPTIITASFVGTSIVSGGNVAIGP